MPFRDLQTDLFTPASGWTTGRRRLSPDVTAPAARTEVTDRSRNDESVRNINQIYESRFDAADAMRKDAIWREVSAYLQRFIDPNARVLDIACDRGHFIRNVCAKEKWATDIRDVSHYLTADVRFVQANALQLHEVLPQSYFDNVFISNYLEHLPSGDAVVELLVAVRKLLKPHGRVIVLQPNIRLIGGAYWNFIDHRVALTDHSLVEAAILAGLSTVHLVERFLPFTTKNRLPQHPMFVRAYLLFRPAWFALGKQTLYIGEPNRS